MSTNAIDMTQSLLSAAEYDNAQKKRLETPIVESQPVSPQQASQVEDHSAGLADFLKIKARESSFIEGVSGSTGRDNWIDAVNKPFRADLSKDLHEVDIAYSIDHKAVANNVKDFTEKYGAEVGMDYMRIAYSRPAMSQKAFDAQAQKFWYEQIDKQKQDNAGFLPQLAAGITDPGALAVDTGIGVVSGGVGLAYKGLRAAKAAEATATVAQKAGMVGKAVETAGKVADAVKTVVGNPKYETAMSVVGAAKRGAMEAIPGSILQEVYLQGTQYSRDSGDALPNILSGIGASGALAAGSKILQKGGAKLFNLKKIETSINAPEKLVEEHAKTSQAMNGFDKAPEAGDVVTVRAGGDEHPTVVVDTQPHAVTVYDPVTHKTMTVDHADVHTPTDAHRADARASLSDVIEQIKQTKAKAAEMAQFEAASKVDPNADPVVDAKVSPDAGTPAVMPQGTDPLVTSKVDMPEPTDAEVGKAVVEMLRNNETRKVEPKTRRAKQAEKQQAQAPDTKADPAVKPNETPNATPDANAPVQPKVGDKVSFTGTTTKGEKVSYTGTVHAVGDKLIVKTDEMYMPVSKESIQKVEPMVKPEKAMNDGSTVFDRAAEDFAGSDLGRLASVSPAASAMDAALHGRVDEANAIMQACART